MRSAARVGIVGALVAAVVSAGSTVGATSDNNGRGRSGGHRSPRGDLRGEPQLRQPLRELARRRRARQEARQHAPERPGRHDGEAVQLPAPEGRQPDVATARWHRRARCRLGRLHRRSRARSPTSRSGSTTTSVPTDTTCPKPDEAFLPANANGVAKGSGLPGGCTRDLVHKFYQEQYQIDGGKMDRYTVGSDAAGLTQGYYDTHPAADLQVPDRARRAQVRRSSTTSSRRPSVGPSSTISGSSPRRRRCSPTRPTRPTPCTRSSTPLTPATRRLSDGQVLARSTPRWTRTERSTSWRRIAGSASSSRFR